MYYKIRSLHQLGIKVHLHCFEYGRQKAKELAEITEEVHYYERSRNKALLLHGMPYVVVSRRSEDLVNRLCKDDYPILFEGLHSCYHLGDNRLHGRIRMVRTHNVEHHYYQALAEVEESSFKRAYFQREARKLEKYEPVLSEADYVIPISQKDVKYFRHWVGKGELVSAFHSNRQVDVPNGLGSGALYHGNLAVAENDRAACYLIEEVFSHLDVPLTIAGSGPSKRLKELAKSRNISLITDADPERMNKMVQEAQINVLPTFQSTGIKLKLLLCLFAGRHVVVNTPMVKETGLASLCYVHDEPEAMAEKIKSLTTAEMSDADISARKSVLEQNFSNEVGARKIIELLWGV